MKKLSLLLGAFLLGVLVSITIHACGGDGDSAPGPNQVHPGPNDDPGTGDNVSYWDIVKVVKSESRDEDGSLSTVYEYQYDDTGRLVSNKFVTYSKDPATEKDYRYHVSEATYTYSSDGATRDGVHISTSFNPDGSLKSRSKYTTHDVLYKK